MDSKKLFDVLGDLNEDLIVKAAPEQEQRVHHFKLRRVWIAAVAVVLVMGLTIGAGAAGVPFFEDILGLFRGNGGGGRIVRDSEVDEYAQPVISVSDTAPEGLQVTESYFDGQVLVFSTSITLEGNIPEEYRVLVPTYDLKFTANGEELHPEYAIETGIWMERISENTYAGAVSLYPKEQGSEEQLLGLPESFELSVGVSTLKALDTKHFVVVERSTYEEESFEITELPEPFSFTVQTNDELRKVYEVNETVNGCTVYRVTVSPAWTEIQIDLDESLKNPAEDNESIIMFAYDSKGKELMGLDLAVPGTSTYYFDQKFRTLDKDETSITVKFFKKNNKYDPIAEITVPVDGGYYEEKPVTQWNDFDPLDVVYDPLPEKQGTYEVPRTYQVVELGETVTQAATAGLKSGKMDVCIDNLRYFDSWQDAGIEERDMNISDYEIENSDEFIFVMMDITLETHDAVAAQYEEGVPTYWISSIVQSSGMSNEDIEAFYEQEPGALFMGEISYFSEHGNGFGDYYHYTIGENEKKTVQVGYMVDKDDINSGKMILFNGLYVWHIPPEALYNPGIGVVEIGETAQLGRRTFPYGTMDVRYENLRYYDSWQDAGIDERDMNLREIMLEQPEDYTFVMLDVVLESHDMQSNVIEDGKPTYWISSIAESTYSTYQRIVDASDPDTTTVIGAEEIQYFSEHGNGISDYYHFTIGENEKKTVQVGYFVKTSELQAGNVWVINREFVYNIPPR